MATVAKKAWVNAITGIKVDEVDEVMVAKSLREVGLDADPTENKDAHATQLFGHFSEKIPDGDKVTCWRCNGLSDVNLDLCPYCGAGDEPEAKEQTQPKKVEEAPKKTASQEDVATESTTKKKEATMTTAKKKATTLVVVDDTTPSSMIHNVRELDTAVQEVQRLKGAGAVAMWELGAAIKVIYDNQLWKLRSDDAGKPKYKSTDAFCNMELGMTPQNAYKLMDLSVHFKADDVRKFGTAKLGLLLEAPAEDRKRIQDEMEKAKKEGRKVPSFREVEKEVRKVNKTKKNKGRESRGKKMPTGGGRKKTEKTITIASVVGSNTVKLYTKATFKEDPKDQKRAKKLADGPWGKMELENGVVQYFSIQETTAGELTLRVETKREEAAE